MDNLSHILREGVAYLQLTYVHVGVIRPFDRQAFNFSFFLHRSRVSPICCTKNAPSDLLDVLYLDSSNLKWSSSLHTSYAEDEAVKIEKEFADLTDTPYHVSDFQMRFVLSFSN